MAIHDIQWISVYNDSGEEIPAFALMRMSGVDTEGVLKVAKPNKNGQTDVLVNSPVPIPIAKYGQGHRNSPCAVYYDTGDGTPAVGETWGAEASSWKANKSQSGMLILGGVVSPIVSVSHSLGAPANPSAITNLTQNIDNSTYNIDNSTYNVDDSTVTYNNVELFFVAVENYYVDVFWTILNSYFSYVNVVLYVDASLWVFSTTTINVTNISIVNIDASTVNIDNSTVNVDNTSIVTVNNSTVIVNNASTVNIDNSTVNVDNSTVVNNNVTQFFALIETYYVNTFWFVDNSYYSYTNVYIQVDNTSTIVFGGPVTIENYLIQLITNIDLSTNQNNFLILTPITLINATAPIDITGFSGVLPSGTFTITNSPLSTDPITIPNGSGSSTIPVYTATGASRVIEPGESMTLCYSAALGGYVEGGNTTGVGAGGSASSTGMAWVLKATITHANLTDADMSQTLAAWTQGATEAVAAVVGIVRTVASGGGVTVMSMGLLRETTPVGSGGSPLVADDRNCQYIVPNGWFPFSIEGNAVTWEVIFTADVNLIDLTGGSFEIWALCATVP